MEVVLMARWQVQEAKQRFSELVRLARDEGPQIVSKHGIDVVVVVDMEQFHQLSSPPRDFKDFLRGDPSLSDVRLDELDLERSAEPARVVEFGLSK